METARCGRAKHGEYLIQKVPLRAFGGDSRIENRMSHGA